ncbi:KH domain-containing protein [Psidium guajava]|nr:KH domain-containing protein [Psidium guajava]
MIACCSRSLAPSRLDPAIKLTRSYVVSRLANNFQCAFQGVSCNWTMDKKDPQSSVEQKKRRKKIDLVCRPISTQAACFEVKDMPIKSEGTTEVQKVHGSIIGRASVAEKDIAEAEIEITESLVSSSIPDVGADTEPALHSDKHSISVEVGSSLMRFVKGKGGSTQKKIEEEMKVKIVFPSSRMDDHIVIEGDSREAVNCALQKVQTIVGEAVESPLLDYSHFVSLPLAIHPTLVEKLFNFQNCILGTSNSSADEIVDGDSSEDTSEGEDGEQESRNAAVKLEVADGKEQVKVNITSIPIVSYPPKATSSSSLSDFGIDKSIFIKPKTFHLTVLMLKLWNKDRVAAAAEVLQNISSKVREALDNRPIFIRLRGLDCMRGSVAKARVLYARVEEIGNEGRLLRACQVIIDAYTEAGLVLEKDAKQTLKLHATVMNARHRKSKRRTRKADSFDARGIFKQYGSEEWGDYLLREAHLSQRFVFDENGYYHCCASIPFPESMQLD